MLNKWTQHWKSLALRGALAVIFGILALFWPKLTISIVLILFGVYAAIDGIITVWNGLHMRDHRSDWWIQCLQGVAGLIIGGITIFAPIRTAQLLIYAVGFWALIVGAMQVILAYLMRKEIQNEWSLAMGGMFELVIGIVLLALPATINALLGLVGIFALVLGIILILFSLHLRTLAQNSAQQMTARTM